MHFQEMFSISQEAFVFSHPTRCIEIEKVMPYVMLSDSGCPFTNLTRKTNWCCSCFQMPETTYITFAFSVLFGKSKAGIF